MEESSKKESTIVDNKKDKVKIDDIDNNSEMTEELKIDENDEEKNDKKNTNTKNKKKKKKKKKNKNEINEEETEEDKIIKETMGFNKFGSTKNRSHKDTDVSAVFLGRKAKRIYQRFMNYKPFSKILKQTYMSLNQEL